MDTNDIPTPDEETAEAEADAVETSEPSTEVEGVEEEGGHVRYGYDDSNSKVDTNALHSKAE